MTTLVMGALLLFGTMAYQRLPVSDLPNVDFPTILVTANLPGASPETMASSVATPLERQFTTIAGLDSMVSSSGLGLTQITLTFTLDRNIDAAAQDVQASITKAASLLPKDMPTPPSYQKVNPADQPVLYLALSSPTLPLFTVDEYAQTFIAQRISTVSGVAQVQVFGSQKYAVRIQLDPDALASRGIGIDEVAQAVGQGNVNLPTGTLYGPFQAFTLETSGQLKDAGAYLPLVVAYRNGAPVRLRDIGTVIDSVENDKVASWYNKTRAIVLAIQRQPGTNTVEVVDAIRTLLPTFRSQMPASVDLAVLYDRSVSIRDSVHDVKFTLVLAIGLVVMVIFLFLRNVSATVIPSLALPMSIVGTFAVMYLLGYSLDNLSLMALTLSVGFVVDDAIVMLENIVRHMEMGKDPRQAAFDGSQRDRLHHPVDDPFARRGLHPGPVHGRDRRASPPRIRRDDHRRHPHLRDRFPHPDAHAVQPVSPASVVGKARPRLRRLGTGLRRHARGLRLEPHEGPAAPADHAPSFRRPLRRDGVPVRLHPQGVPAERGHRAPLHVHRGGAGDLLRLDEGAPDRHGGHHRQGPERRVADVQRWAQRPERLGELGAHLHPPQAPGGTRLERGRGDPGDASEAGRHPRDPRVHAEPSPDPDRRAAHEEPVPAHAPEPGHRRTVPAGPRPRGKAARPAGTAGRDERPADHEPAGQRDDRPGQGEVAGRLGGADRERPLQRLRRPAGFHHLRAQQHVQGHPGAPPGVPDGPGGALPRCTSGPPPGRRCRCPPWPGSPPAWARSS